MSRMEVKTSLLDNMIGVGDMVLLEPLTEESFIENLRKRFDHTEIYVSPPSAFLVPRLRCEIGKRSGGYLNKQ